MLRTLIHQIAATAERLLTPFTLIIASAVGFLITMIAPYLQPLTPRDLAAFTMLAPAFLAVFTVMVIAKFIETEAAKIALRLHALEVHFHIDKAMEDARALRLAIRAVHAGARDIGSPPADTLAQREHEIYTLPDPDETEVQLPEGVEGTSDQGQREHIKIGGSA